MLADGQDRIEPFDAGLKQVADCYADSHRGEYPDRQVPVEERQVLRHTLRHHRDILVEHSVSWPTLGAPVVQNRTCHIASSNAFIRFNAEGTMHS